MKFCMMFFTCCLMPVSAWAAEGVQHEPLDLTASHVGIAALIIFAVAYVFVMAEEFIGMRKSKPVIIAAGVIWIMLGAVYTQHGMQEVAEQAVRHNLLEYAELMLFLLVAMTYINAMQERRVFDAMRAWMVKQGYGFRKLFWITGFLSFLISPIADNLTTALLMCAIVLAVGRENQRFVSISCVNIVVAANAGGAFSPFGDITTLMVWQKGVVQFETFFLLLVPSLVNYLLPAAVMFFFVPDEQPQALDEQVVMHRGARRVMALFLATITTTVLVHHFVGLPPVIGMMTGLGYLQLLGFYLRITPEKCNVGTEKGVLIKSVPFDIFNKVARVEWDTLLFFYGVVMCVGGLGLLGYLAMASELMYNQWGVTNANIFVGMLSAIVDNIPVMFAVLTMQPEMNQAQWLLVTLTAGVGGSMLSIGSAAGVALMGQARGAYTFFSHLKWTPVIALGYAASIWVHILINF